MGKTEKELIDDLFHGVITVDKESQIEVLLKSIAKQLTRIADSLNKMIPFEERESIKERDYNKDE